uniref:Uncharacterized protein n=1 Tax=Hyaloperonospora arabidopsidis (strain Emoy2) TaxID=559515 RepID=M4BVH6_HYAAE
MEDRLFYWFLLDQERATISDTVIWTKKIYLFRAESFELKVELVGLAVQGAARHQVE